MTGALTMAFAVESRAPHGGIFVFFAISPIWGFLTALVAGVVVTALVVVGLKRFVAPKELASAEASATDASQPAMA